MGRQPAFNPATPRISASHPASSDSSSRQSTFQSQRCDAGTQSPDARHRNSPGAHVLGVGGVTSSSATEDRRREPRCDEQTYSPASSKPAPTIVRVIPSSLTRAEAGRDDDGDDDGDGEADDNGDVEDEDEDEDEVDDALCDLLRVHEMTSAAEAISGVATVEFPEKITAEPSSEEEEEEAEEEEEEEEVT